ncbi:hypothetical protein ACOSQ4_026857 [Xanthoceras sorbifolium]
MLSMNVSKYLWGEAVLTATYLINRVPSRVLKHNTPLNYLKNYFPTNRLSSSLPLKIFGCTIFVHQPRLSQSKLDARAKKCVFIGYAPSQKGYKCFNPSNRRTYLSMDVKFLENQPFFTNHLQGENHKKDEIQQVSNLIPAGPLSSGSGLAPFLDFPKPDASLFDHTNQPHHLVETGNVQPESEAGLDDPHKENHENLGPKETEPDLQVLDHTLPLHTESDIRGENLQEKNLHLGNNPAEFKTYTRRKNQSSGVQTHQTDQTQLPRPESNLNSTQQGKIPIDNSVFMECPPGFEKELGKEKYQRLVGRLINLAYTRLDISFAVSLVSQFMCSPGPQHHETVLRILRYLKGTLGRCLLFANRGHLQVEIYTDADWAGSVTDKRSTSGYCAFVRGNLVTWRSKKQGLPKNQFDKLVCTLGLEDIFKRVCKCWCMTWIRTTHAIVSYFTTFGAFLSRLGLTHRRYLGLSRPSRLPFTFWW